MGLVALSFWRPARALGQFGVCGGLINEHQTRQNLAKKTASARDPQVTFLLDVETIMFTCQQAFFYG